jgi:ribosomal-protein-alanine N-acetyltransferase
MVMPELQTDRLQIRTFTQPLLEASLQDRGGALAAQLNAVVPSDWPGPDFADVIPFLLEQAKANPITAELTSLILRDGQLIGDIGFKSFPDEEGRVEIGYSLVPAARGHGYATEAVRAMVAWALKQPGVRQVIAETEAWNEPSMRVLERAGFRQVGPRDGLVDWIYAG